MKDKLPFFPKELEVFGYQGPQVRKDLWAEPRAAIGIDNKWQSDLSLFYWKGRPLIAIANNIPKLELIAYALGQAFKVPPPLLIICDGDQLLETQRLQDGAYATISAPVAFADIDSLPPGMISELQATNIVQSIWKRNSEWLENSLSQAIVGTLPRIFPEGTLILYELLQNAADAQAENAVFNLHDGILEFLHDGNPFTENDVDAIAFVNISFKPAETIGFMGLGFKSAYEVTLRPEIHSCPYYFAFDRNQSGGELLPVCLQQEAREAIPTEFTTMFRFPLKSESNELIETALNEFDGRLLLYIGNRLRKIVTPYNSFTLQQKAHDGKMRKVALKSNEGEVKQSFLIFSHDFIPTAAAVSEFAESRNTDVARYQGRKQVVSLAVETLEGSPVVDKAGMLHVFLPTSIKLPFSFDVQGNFLIDASRRHIRHGTGPWNAQHFAQIGIIVTDVLRYAKSQFSSGNKNWIDFYNLIPSWSEAAKLYPYLILDQVDPDHPSASSLFKQVLEKNELIPVVSKGGSCLFITSENAAHIETDLEVVFKPTDLFNLFKILPIWTQLSEKAKTALKPVISTKIDVAQLIEVLSKIGWEKNVTTTNGPLERPESRRQIAQILAFLKIHEMQGLIRRDYKHCRVILDSSKSLRAATEEDRRPIRCLPSTEVDFPPEELNQKYELVHQTLLRDLRRSSESGLELQSAQKALTLLTDLAPELTTKLIATEIVSPAFDKENWKVIPDDRLLRYTKFLFENASKLDNSIKLKVKIRDSERRYLSPDIVYFGKEYSLDGELLERLCGSADSMIYLSDEYLKITIAKSISEWVKFFEGYGVASKPRIQRHSTTNWYFEVDQVRKETEDPNLKNCDLRASSYYDDKNKDTIPYDRYVIDDFQIDDEILKHVRDMYQRKLPGWKEGLRALSILIDKNWPYYSEYTKIILRYVYKYTSYVNRDKKPALTSLGKLLINEPWLPALDIDDAFMPIQLVNPTQQNKTIAGEATTFAIYLFENPDLIEFLKLNVTPAESTPISRLRGLVQHKDMHIETFKTAYRDITESKSITDHDLRSIFATESLIFVPNQDDKYLSSKRVLFKSRTNLLPYFACIGDTYPEFKDFFCSHLDIPEEEQLDHYIDFLKDYVWKYQPSVPTSLRDTIGSCYRALLNHLNEQPPAQLEGTLSQLRERFNGCIALYCGEKFGWVNSIEHMVLFPDTVTYISMIEEKANIPIESHIKRIERPLHELKPILKLLNVKLLSEAIKEDFLPHGPQLSPDSHIYSSHLSMLFKAVEDIVKAYQAESISSHSGMALFLDRWATLIQKLGNVQFFQASRIELTVFAAETAMVIHRGDIRAYVYEESSGLKIYITRDILSIYDALAANFNQLMRIDLLPREIRDKVGGIIHGNIARLGIAQFADALREYLTEHGFIADATKDLSEQLVTFAQSAASAATSDVAGEGQDNPAEVQTGPITDDGIKTGSITPTNGGSSNKTDETPVIPTEAEVLSSLPDFTEASFAREYVINMQGQDLVPVPIGSGSHGKYHKAHGGLTKEQWEIRRIKEAAYGKRGELWVFEYEKRLLKELGKNDLSERVVHCSIEKPGSPWDIESFEKTPPYAPILIEVKSTSDPNDLTCHMSAEQIGEALRKQNYYVYRVVNVTSAHPRAYSYLFHVIWEANKINVSATNVLVKFPVPPEGKTISKSEDL